MTRATRPPMPNDIAGRSEYLASLDHGLQSQDHARRLPVDLAFDVVVANEFWQADEVGHGEQVGVPSGQDCGRAFHTLGPLSLSR